MILHLLFFSFAVAEGVNHVPVRTYPARPSPAQPHSDEAPHADALRRQPLRGRAPASRRLPRRRPLLHCPSRCLSPLGRALIVLPPRGRREQLRPVRAIGLIDLWSALPSSVVRWVVESRGELPTFSANYFGCANTAE